jgi:Holliday junction resolvase RusA-like endonuclease
MSEAITITVLGEPVSMVRVKGIGHGYPFIPAKQRNAAANFRLAAQLEMKYRRPLDGPLHVDFLAVRSIPRSWSKKKQAGARDGVVYPTSKPDLDNLWKLAIDACNAVVFRDDALIVSATKSKIYGDQPRIEITVSRLGLL